MLALYHLKDDYYEYINDSRATSDNTAYMLRANALALRDVVYAGNVIRNRLWDGFKQ